jgi:hypothetical protein
MPVLARTLRAEALKLKRTRALWLAVGAPLAVVVLHLLLVVSGRVNPAETRWAQQAQSMIGMWAMFMLPLYVALETALINAVDHKANAWKGLFSLPVPRWSVHVAKLVMAFAMVALSSVILGVGFLTTIVALKAVGVGAASDPVPWSLVFHSSLYSYGGALGIISIHHGLSLRLQGFEWPLGIGIVGMVFGTQVSLSSTYWPLLPWGYTTVATVVSDPEHRLWAIVLSGSLALLGGLVSGYDTAHRDIL